MLFWMAGGSGEGAIRHLVLISMWSRFTLELPRHCLNSQKRCSRHHRNEKPGTNFQQLSSFHRKLMLITTVFITLTIYIGVNWARTSQIVSFSRLFCHSFTVARSKAWTVLTSSNTGIVGSTPTQGMDICLRLYSIWVVLCAGSDLATGWSLVQGVLPTVYRIKKLKNETRSNKRIVEP
jgi:hypothetical protein